MEAMILERSFFIDYLLQSGTASFDELFNPDYTFVNQPLALHYGLNGVDGEQMQKVSVDRNRGGLLHQGILQILNSDFQATSLVKRGKMIRENMMCHTMGVPSGVDPAAIVLPESAITTRERWDHITGPAASEAQCWQCHQLMNEPGSSLESYDQNGQYRLEEDAYNVMNMMLPIDTSGTLRHSTNLSSLVEYNDARGLTEYFSSSDDIRDCFVESYFRFSQGSRSDNLSEKDLLSLQEQFQISGNIKQMVKTSLLSDFFMFRLNRE
jgi:hypothetical protein